MAWVFFAYREVGKGREQERKLCLQGRQRLLLNNSQVACRERDLCLWIQG